MSSPASTSPSRANKRDTSSGGNEEDLIDQLRNALKKSEAQSQQLSVECARLSEALVQKEEEVQTLSAKKSADQEKIQVTNTLQLHCTKNGHPLPSLYLISTCRLGNDSFIKRQMELESVEKARRAIFSECGEALKKVASAREKVSFYPLTGYQ
jgi:predicted  nucleic acid-binding Zn-ribbon protein